MLTCARWYVAYPLSLRQIEEMMQERGVFANHATVHRRAIKILPVLAAVFRRRKHPVGTGWRMDETYVKVFGQWRYLYRDGDSIDFLFTAKRDRSATLRFLERAIDLHGVPEKITLDKSGANTAAIEIIQAASSADIVLRQSKYLNNIVEQDSRAVKRIVRPMLGFKFFGCTPALIAGIEAMRMIRKGQLDCPKGQAAPQLTSSTAWPFDPQLTSQLR